MQPDKKGDKKFYHSRTFLFMGRRPFSLSFSHNGARFYGQTGNDVIKNEHRYAET